MGAGRLLNVERDVAMRTGASDVPAVMTPRSIPGSDHLVGDRVIGGRMKSSFRLLMRRFQRA
jgi:hypothetical protein